MQLPRLLSAAAACLACLTCAEAKGFLEKADAVPEPSQDEFARRSWLAAHLKEHLEMDRGGYLREQSGLNIPWDWKESRPRNAGHDCEDGPDAIVKKATDQMAKAAQAGKLSASRLSAKN